MNRQFPCSEHSGFEARITNIENNLTSIREELKQMKKDVDSVSVSVFKKISHMYIMMIAALLGLVANLGILFLRSHI